MTVNVITLRCEYCEKPFQTPNWKNRERRFCSKSCAVRWASARRNPPPVTMTCENPYCCAPFTVPQWRVDQGARYCSRSCSATVNNDKRKERTTDA